MEAAAPSMSMKIVVDQKAKRVLFAEASKDVVDFLFSLLALPIATAVKLVGKEAMVGSVGNLYASVDKLDSTYVLPGAAKDAFLCPTVYNSSRRLPVPAAPALQLLQNASRGSGNSKQGKKKKKNSRNNNTKNASVGISGEATEGFVQGIVTYRVLDNLTVTPMSAISSITLLNTFAVRDLGDLQEKTVQLGNNEGLAILKASLHSKTVLTDVFLHGKAASPAGRA